jgi:hypothetical protein
MSRNQEFEGGRLFHGARTRIEGDMVLPPNVTGVDAQNSNPRSYSGGSDGPHNENAWSSSMPGVAWRYANTPSLDIDAPENRDPDPKYRGRVYEVEHAHDEVSDGGETASRTGFRIMGEQESEAGKQMTLSGINWNAFKPVTISPHSGHQSISRRDYNHSSGDPSPPVAYPDPPQEVHPDQLNLFSGKTASEHSEYEQRGRIKSGTTIIGDPTPGKRSLRKDPATVIKQKSKSNQMATNINNALVGTNGPRFRAVS